jgi:hypothetical protein
MAQNRGSLFQQLTRLFKSGPIVKRKVRSADTRVAGPDMTGQSSSVLLLSKTSVGNFNSIISGGQGYVTQERMSRLQDFNEMDAYAEINAALDIYSDESVAQDAAGRSLHIHSDNPAIKKNLEELFYNTLNAEFNLRPWTRNLVKYGDFFLYIDVSPEYGVINVIPVPVNELTREEGYDPHDPLAVRFRWMTLGNRTLENWEVAHFRLMGNDQYLPYGSSMLDGARRIWRQLVLIEDAMLVYRVTRSPERRVFYIDVGGVAPDEIANYMEAAKTNIKSSQVIDRATGRVDLRYNPLSVEEDYWIPVRGTDTNTKIDTLQAGQNTGNVEDVQYIQKKLIAALKVPAAYLGYNDAIPGSSGLAQVDVRFSRTVNMIQRTLVSEMNKIAMVHLFAAGFRGDDLVDFEIRLSNPSTIAQQQKLELLRTRFEIAASAPPSGPGGEHPLMSERWIQRNVMGLNDQEILQNKRERLDDVRAAGAFEAAGVLAGGAEGADAGGGPEEGLDAGGPPDASAGGGADEGPGLETASDDNRGQGDLITSTAVDGETRVREGDSPVKLMPGLKKALYNQRRNLRRRTHGKVNVLDRAVSGATIKPSMPESRSMLQEAFNDVYEEENAEQDMFVNDQSRLLKQEAVLAPTITVKPVVGQSELRMMRELSQTKGLNTIASNQWNDEKRRERVLVEHFAPTTTEIEFEDVKDFELYDDERKGD